MNYRSTIDYYQYNKKNPRTISSWVDTCVFDLNLWLEKTQTFFATHKLFTKNSNNYYFDIPRYNDLTFQATVQFDKYWLALNISIDSDEFPNFPACQIYYNKATTIVKGMTKATFYGLFFRFCELSNIDRRILAQDIADKLWLGNNLLKLRVMRLDYKTDIIGITPAQFYDRLYNYNRRKSTILKKKNRTPNYYDKNGELETAYIWSKKSRFAFARIYNKTRDTEKKEKTAFYFDYPDPVTRVELQFWSQFIGDCNLSQLMTKVFSYLGYPAWHKWNYFVADRYDPSVIIKVEEYKQRRLKQGKKLIENGVPLGELIIDLKEHEHNFHRRIISSRYLYSIPFKSKLLLFKTTYV